MSATSHLNADAGRKGNAVSLLMLISHSLAPHSASIEDILPRHHERLAIVYVRQSDPQQVLQHRESKELQYNLGRPRGRTLGWPRERVLVIDEDQGQSAQSAASRSRLSTFTRGSGAGPRRACTRFSNESLGTVEQRLASTIGGVRAVWHFAHRLGRHV